MQRSAWGAPEIAVSAAVLKLPDSVEDLRSAGPMSRAVRCSRGRTKWLELWSESPEFVQARAEGQDCAQHLKRNG